MKPISISIILNIAFLVLLSAISLSSLSGSWGYYLVVVPITILLLVLNLIVVAILIVHRSKRLKLINNLDILIRIMRMAVLFKNPSSSHMRNASHYSWFSFSSWYCRHWSFHISFSTSIFLHSPGLVRDISRKHSGNYAFPTLSRNP